MTGMDAGFRIRLERDLRDKFIEMCRAKDHPAAQAIRDFMRQYIEENEAANDTEAAKKGAFVSDKKNLSGFVWSRRCRQLGDSQISV